MKNPLISVVVPIYNVEPYLRQCVDSLLAQTYGNLQIILVNDGSPDGCPAICDEYARKDGRVQVVHKPNGGLSNARNAGLESCKGQYVFFLDADDYLDRHCFETLVPAAESGALAMTGYLLDFSDTGNIVEAKQAYGRYVAMKDYFLDFHNLFATKFNFSWGKLYDTNIIRKNNLKFRKGMSLCEDVVFNMEYYRHCSNGVNAVRHDGYYYRQHGGDTLSKAFNKKRFEWNEYCYTSVRDYLKEFNAFTEENRLHLYRNIAGNYHYCFHLVALNKQMGLGRKAQLIRDCLTTPIYRDSLTAVNKQRIDYRFMYWCLHHGMTRTYILLEQTRAAAVRFLKPGHQR